MLLIGAWLFDFQSEGAGQGLAIQAIFLGTYLFAFIAFLIGDKAHGKSMRGIGLFIVTSLLFLSVGSVSGLVHGQEFYPILRNATSVFVYASSAYATARTMVSVDLKALRKFLGIACLVYAVSTLVIYNTTSGGIELDRVRFQIVGGSALAAMAFVSLTVLFRLNYVELAALVVNGLILLLAVTRTYLVAFAAQALVLVLNFQKLFTGKLVLVVLAGAIALVGLEAFGQNQLTRWSDRVVSSDSNFSEYETYYTRLSEWNFMYDSWTGSSREFLIGSGFAAETTYFYTSAQGGGAEHMTGFGHNQYLSTVFTAGAIGGLPILLLQMWQGVLALLFLRQILLRPGLRSDAAFLGAWGAMIILGTLAANVFSNSYSTRSVAMWYGIGTGLLIAALSGRSAPPLAIARPKAGLGRASRRLG